MALTPGQSDFIANGSLRVTDGVDAQPVHLGFLAANRHIGIAVVDEVDVATMWVGGLDNLLRRWGEWIVRWNAKNLIHIGCRY